MIYFPVGARGELIRGDLHNSVSINGTVTTVSSVLTGTTHDSDSMDIEMEDVEKTEPV